MSRHKPIAPLSARDHNKAPKPLVGEDDASRATIGLNYMTFEELEEFGDTLDSVRQRVLDDLGQKDADYIHRLIRVQQTFEVLGRIGMFFPFFWPVFVAGIVFLSLSKIIENMEIGHNVMHGQYDWMNDPQINGLRYEWDNVAPAKDWKHTHNHIHHTYTNIHGKDKDIGYGLVRIDRDQPYKWKYLGNPLYAFVLMLIFEFGVMSHGTGWDEALKGKKLSAESKIKFKRAGRKIRHQMLKDYVYFPALSLPLVPFTSWWVPLAVAGGNLAANVVRNIWAFLIIFCGHFPVEVESFHQKDAENETRGQWYLRQLLGSANISGGKVFHIMSGNLSYQIEHHLFPDIPARRYPEVAQEVRALCEKYGLNYNSGRLSRQLFSVWKQLFQYAMPPKDPAQWHWRYGKTPRPTDRDDSHKSTITA